jgi:acetate kinase
MNSKDLEFLKNNVALLAEFSDAQREEIANGSRVEIYEPRQTIVHAGDEVHFLGVVLEGTVAAFAHSANGESHLLGKIAPGETFCEMGLMTGDPAMADLVAETRCRVMLVPITLFQSHIMAAPRAVKHISRTIGARLQQVMSDPVKAAAVTRKEDVAGMLELKGERPERILVINCGSSSLKYSLFDTENPENIANGQIERIGKDGTKLVQRGGKGEIARELPQGGYAEAFAAMLTALMDKDAAVIKDASAISVVGHRVVHGGEKFTSAVVIDDAVLAEIEALSPLAPLHNPVNVAGIREARRVFAAVPHVAVFDTAFHATLPSHAYIYGFAA